jgi:formylglycine-generating enzyme required for sulfatase activity/tRNA A-37 threonylcarbamoyl transferase component Bud32
MLVCPACHAHNKEVARFCSACGFNLAVLTALPSMTVLQERYTIVERIGGGGMSTVYKAFDTRLGNASRAVKEIKVAHQLDPEERAIAIEQFRREAEILARLDHPNLPKVYDYFLENGRHYLVMDFVDGQDLGWILEHQPDELTEETVINRIVQLCNVLEYLHNQTPPVVFRDLKPSNIMVTRGGTIKLIDFGIARFFEPHREKDTRVMGTPGYAAPEQYGRTQTDARSDIYSLGVVLHELLTHSDPSETPFNLPRLCTLNPKASKMIEGIIERATSVDPNRRFPSAKQFREALVGMPLRRPTNGVVIATRETVAELLRQENPPSRVWWEKAEMELCLVPGGYFLMGSRNDDPDAENDEKPQHRVSLSSYYIGRYPVTQAQYARFVQSTGHRYPEIESWWVASGLDDVDKEGDFEYLDYDWVYGSYGKGVRRPVGVPSGKEDHPVILVSWDDAVAFCQWAGLRLPTEAEWEKAARGVDGRAYPWGNEWDPRRCNNAVTGTTPVGTYSPGGDSPYGCGDMVGNVEQWVADWYDPGYYAGKSYWSNPCNNYLKYLEPHGGEARVARGRSYWLDDPAICREACRCAARMSCRPDRRDEVGFRCCVSLTSWEEVRDGRDW